MFYRPSPIAIFPSPMAFRNRQIGDISPSLATLVPPAGGDQLVSDRAPQVALHQHPALRGQPIGDLCRLGRLRLSRLRCRGGGESHISGDGGGCGDSVVTVAVGHSNSRRQTGPREVPSSGFSGPATPSGSGLLSGKLGTQSQSASESSTKL